MSGGAWVAVFLDGNDGKWHCRPTLFRGHYFQSVTWAGWTGDGEPRGVCYRAANVRLTLRAPNEIVAWKVPEIWR